ncbi:MAG: LysR family transcriptional regulator [Eubacteriales bacterium]
MLDNRIYTFLELCKVMNYRKTAEKLNMTQPAVTQHIKYLEAEYQCKLFEYHSKILSKTEKCIELEQHARALVYADNAMLHKISESPVITVAIGATKTIGEYTIEDTMLRLLQQEDVELHLIIDNTKHLLEKLDNLELDFLMLEGYFDKNSYGYKPIKKERVIGICAKEHPFAGKEVELQEVFKEHLIMREEGSGTRSVFDHFLEDRNYSVDSFVRKSVISSYKLIEKAVKTNLGISFVYEAIAEEERFGVFTIKDSEITHEFNYVFLQNVLVDKLFERLNIEGDWKI